jgi:hypothetical protein
VEEGDDAMFLVVWGLAVGPVLWAADFFVGVNFVVVHAHATQLDAEKSVTNTPWLFPETTRGCIIYVTLETL